MGESFIGIPNRLMTVDHLLDSTYNPNHALSSHMGYALLMKFSNYLPTSGGTINGTLQTSNIYPYTSSVFDLGTSTQLYRNVYADTLHGNLHGNATSASKLKVSRLITITGAVTGSCTFDGSADSEIVTEINHNHDDRYLKLTGGTITGNIIMSNNSSILGSGGEFLTLTSDDVLKINYGTYLKETGNTTIYSSGDLDVRTHSSGITVTSSLFNKTVNLGTSRDSVFVANTESDNYLHLTDDGRLLINDNEVYHTGKFDSNNMLTTEYKEHMDQVEQIIKALAIALDKLEVFTGMKAMMEYPDHNVEGELSYLKAHAMDILGSSIRKEDTTNG